MEMMKVMMMVRRRRVKVKHLDGVSAGPAAAAETRFTPKEQNEKK